MAVRPAPSTLPAPLARAPWTVRLLGAVEAIGPEGYFTRWPSRAVAGLLGRLALGPQRAHSREELIELLWPGVALDVGRNRLRQALSTLKSLLEGPGPDGPAVIHADRLTVRLAPGAVNCDAVEFERALRSGDATAARALYQGELMPGHYDDWVLEERGRLATLFERLEALPTLPAPAAPAQAALQAPPDTLPSYWTQLYGVELVASRLRALVAQQRLVTVCGAGGSGKTRLAVEVAQALRDAPSWRLDQSDGRPRFDRVTFVPLVDCVDAAQCLDAIATALRISGSDPAGRIAEALAGQRVLLVLDNFEQLAAHARAALEPLLSRTPGLHVLVTSRRRLGITGEQLFELGGLALPDASASTLDIGETMASPAVALFIDRARSARPDFQPGARDAQALRELVWLLDGMPLAIELAASRVRRHPPSELLRRLSGATGARMLDLLQRPAQDATEQGRHDSMRRVVEWSLQQLNPRQRTMLEALATFGAPARAEAVAAVAGSAVEEALALVESLQDASLVQTREDAAGTPRHVLLQPVRERVAEGIAADRARAARQRLRGWLIGFGRQLTPANVHSAAAELPHVYASIAGAAADDAAREAVAVAVAFSRHWVIDTLEPLPGSVMHALHDALPVVADDAAMHCDLCELLSFSFGAGGFADQAQRVAREGVAVAPDPARRSLALTRLCWTLVLSGRERAEQESDRLLAEALELALASGDAMAQALALRMQMMVAVNYRREYVAAEGPVTRAQQIWEGLGDRRNAYRRLLDRATCWAWAGRNEEAALGIAACERAAIEDGDYAGMYMSAWQMGRVCIRLRRWREAAAAFHRCVATGWQRNHMLATSYGLLHMADAMVMTQQADIGARLFGFAIPHWERQYGTINAIEAAELKRTRRLLRMALGPIELEAERLRGRGMSLPDAVALALQAAQRHTQPG